MYAVEAGDLPMCAALLLARPSLAAADEEFETVFHKALWSSPPRLDILGALLGTASDMNWLYGVEGSYGNWQLIPAALQFTMMASSTGRV